MATKTREETTTRRRRVLALAAGAAVLGLGATASFAAWTDSEWVFGGTGADAAGIGTSTFEVEQNTGNGDGWVQIETEPGNELVIADALDLTPGDSAYTSVQLRTISLANGGVADSIAGTLTLQAAVSGSVTGVSDTGDVLFDALDVRVVTDTSPITCDASAFGSLTPIADGPLNATGGSASQSLAAAGGSTQYYCFEVTLPSSENDDSLMGRAVAPAWEFSAAS